MDDPRAVKAEAILARRCDTSVQTLNEFANVARRKLAMDWDEVDAALTAIRALCGTIHAHDLETHQRAMKLELSTLYQMIDRMNIPLLEKLVDRFPAFDEGTASAIGNALSVVLQMKMNPPLDLGDRTAINMQLLPTNIQVTIQEMENTLTHVLYAKKVLQPHFDSQKFIATGRNS